MPLKLVIGARKDRGRVRELNEDNLCVLGPGEVVNDFDALLAVADGMGGQKAGEVASQYATDKLQELFVSTTYRSWVGFNRDRKDYNILVIKEVLERLNREIYDLAGRQEEHRGMGSTLTAALIQEDQIVLGHVGDSRAYMLAGDEFYQLTTDHSWVQEQVEQGRMLPEEAAHDSRKNRITRALGMGSVLRIDRQVVDFQPGNILLLCTDGLTNMLTDSQIRQLLEANADPQKACDALVHAANQRGGVDNIAVIVVKALNGNMETSPVPRDEPRLSEPTSQRASGSGAGGAVSRGESKPTELPTLKMGRPRKPARPAEPETEQEPDSLLPSPEPGSEAPAPVPVTEPQAESPEVAREGEKPEGPSETTSAQAPSPDAAERLMPASEKVLAASLPPGAPVASGVVWLKVGVVVLVLLFEAFVVGGVTFVLQALTIPQELVSAIVAVFTFALLLLNVSLAIAVGPLLTSRSSIVEETHESPSS